LLAGRFAAAEPLGREAIAPPPTTAHGALLAHITGGHIETIDCGPRSFQPMNVNFGLFPPLASASARPTDGLSSRGTAKAVAKKRALCARALHDLENWLNGRLPAAAE
jgi:methylenetetrahydrofolate--tRNA-(uracil-5-)-methyltransferase